MLSRKMTEKILGYLAIARIDHWGKQIFMLVGMLLAQTLTREKSFYVDATMLAGFLIVCLAASANYTLNEWLDRDFDRFHPLKKNRPAPRGLLNSFWVWAQYLLLTSASTWLGFLLNSAFGYTICALLAGGLIYNVPPFRLKDRVYLDVITESINNPIRLLLGWFVIWPENAPPISLLIIFWFGGAFLMAMKRFAEYRMICAREGVECAGNYRKSFQQYTHDGLLLFSFLNALMTAFFLAVFIVKYRAEYLMLFPLIAILFTYYLHLSLKENSIVQTPEKLYREKGVRLLTLLCLVAFAVLSLCPTFVRGLVGPYRPKSSRNNR